MFPFGDSHLDLLYQERDEADEEHKQSMESINFYFSQKKKKIPSSCENYQKFYSRIHEFYSTEKHTDVKIVCENRTFKCHRLVLAAASEYFDKMFCSGFRENHTEEVFLQNIDAATFEDILEYMYQGKVTVRELNLYNLLCASEMLGLNVIEDVCVQYLMERNIPQNNALEIFAFARRTQKNCLLRATSRYLIENLNNFSSNSDFLQFSFDDLKILLEYCPPLSSKMENLIIETLVRWINNLDCALDDKKNIFFMLTQTIKFQYVLPTQIEEYLFKNLINELNIIGSCSDVAGGIDTSTIHVYARNTAQLNFRPSETFLLKMLKNNADDVKKVDWNLSHLEFRNIDHMRVVLFENHLYSFKSQYEPTDILRTRLKSFNICSSVDLSSNSSLLTLPPDLSSSSVIPNLCCDMNNIYLYDYSYEEKGFDQLYVYSQNLDKWSSISLNQEQRNRSPAVMCDSSRLYLIGGLTGRKGLIRTRYLQSYDHRIGRWEQLPKSRLGHHKTDNACIHKEKIYVCSGAPYIILKENLLEIYDTVAGKWDAIKTDDSHHNGPTRLLSFENELYAFYDHPTTLMRKYDPLAQKWSPPSNILPAIGSQPSLESNESKWFILSTLVF